MGSCSVCGRMPKGCCCQPRPHKGRVIWEDDSIQFPRLLAEIRAAGLTPQILSLLRKSMGLGNKQIEELFVRAEKKWERIKDQVHPR